MAETGGERHECRCSQFQLAASDPGRDPAPLVAVRAPPRGRFPSEDIERQLDLAIGWGHYVEPFDCVAGELILGDMAAALTSRLN